MSQHATENIAATATDLLESPFVPLSLLSAEGSGQTEQTSPWVLDDLQHDFHIETPYSFEVQSSTVIDRDGPPSQIDVNFQHVDSLESVESYVVDLQEGSFVVSFIASAPGLYELRVSVNGKEVSGSPRLLLVRP
eukprot:gene5356-7107_t